MDIWIIAVITEENGSQRITATKDGLTYETVVTEQKFVNSKYVELVDLCKCFTKDCQIDQYTSFSYYVLDNQKSIEIKLNIKFQKSIRLQPDCQEFSFTLHPKLSQSNVDYPISKQSVNNTRKITEYNSQQQKVHEIRKKEISCQLERLDIEGTSKIFPNQQKTALQIVETFEDLKILYIMVAAPTQSGKTGIMCSLIFEYFKKNIIPIENIYIITGLSSLDWKKQTKQRMPDVVDKRIFHRAELPKNFAEEIKEKINLLIIIDEVHIAAKNKQTLFKSFESAGILNKSKLYENDIKIVQFTATPDGLVFDLNDEKWSDSSKVICADPGVGYIGCIDLLTQGRVMQYKDLYSYDQQNDPIENIREIKKVITSKYPEQRYHIIRTPNGQKQEIVVKNLQIIFPKNEYKYVSYSSESDLRNINDLLTKKPKKHTFVLIKEKLRCTNTIAKKYNGVLIERHTQNPIDSAIIQGLIGRDTGYDNNGDSITFTNIPSIEKYKSLLESKFKDQSIIWNSQTTKNKNAMTISNGTFDSHGYYESERSSESDLHSTDSLDSNSEDQDHIEPERNIKFKEFVSQDEAIEFFKTMIPLLKDTYKIRKLIGPKRRTANKEGFYQCSIGRGGKKKIHEYHKIKNCKYGVTKKKHFNLRAGYTNIKDPETAVWILAYSAV